MAAIGFLDKDPDNQLVGDVQSAINGLTGNAGFPTPAPALRVISAALSAFTVALAAAVNGGTELTKNAKRAELVSLVRPLASYVTITADGDMTKLLSSGFRYQNRTRSPVGQLSAPCIAGPMPSHIAPGDRTPSILGRTYSPRI